MKGGRGSITSCLSHSAPNSPNKRPVVKLKAVLNTSESSKSERNSRYLNSSFSSCSERYSAYSQSSPLDNSSFGVFCRICHNGDEDERLINVCKCMGSVCFVHHSCLLSWISYSGDFNCELCKYDYKVSRIKKRRLSEVNMLFLYILIDS